MLKSDIDLIEENGLYLMVGSIFQRDSNDNVYANAYPARLWAFFDLLLDVNHVGFQCLQHSVILRLT